MSRARGGRGSRVVWVSDRGLLCHGHVNYDGHGRHNTKKLQQTTQSNRLHDYRETSVERGGISRDIGFYTRRYQIVAGFVTNSSPVALNTRHVGQRCTLNLSRAETSSRWCGVVVRRGGCQESDGSELSCSDLYSNENIRLSESDCEESEKSADTIDNIPVIAGIYIARDDTEWIPLNSDVPGIFATKQWSNKLLET
ncbi:hypothetical protein TNCV_1425681 [Trichonephila clavipes]|nr:hypothetical protein TNCV_1425681 [Trichonephila clavipes]